MVDFVSLCAGIGGIDLGLERAGFRCVWANDISPYAAAVYRRRFPHVPFKEGDIKAVEPSAIPDHTVLAAGFPCPSFSTAGKGAGFDDPRGEVFWEITRIARAKRSPVLFLENVRGLLSNREGETFAKVLSALGDMGYHVEWQVLNSLDFGVPQSRRRVFIIGYLGQRPPRTVFPIRDADEVDLSGYDEQKEQHLNCIDANTKKGVDKHGQRTIIAFQTAHKNEEHGDRLWVEKIPALDARSPSVALIDIRNVSRMKEMGSLRTNPTAYAISFTNPHDSEEERKANLGDHLRTVKPYQGNQQPFIASPPHGNYDGNLKNSINLRANRGGPYNEIVGGCMWLRRPMPIEYERAQGLPDGWTAEGVFPAEFRVWTGRYMVDKRGHERPVMTTAKEEGIYPLVDSHRYELIGNSVTVPVIEYLGRRLASVIEEAG